MFASLKDLETDTGGEGGGYIGNFWVWMYMYHWDPGTLT